MSERHPVTSDCVALWRLDEENASDDAVDATGNGHTGTAVGNPGVFANGKFDSSRDFIPTSQYFSIADAADLRLQEFTIAGWIYYDSTTQNNYYKMIFKDMADSQGFGSVYLQGSPSVLGKSNIAFIIEFGGDLTGANSATLRCDDILSAGQWHHIGALFSSTRGIMLLYIDGNLYGSRTTKNDGSPLAGQSIYYDADVWTLGRDPDWPNQALNGKLDDIAIYNTIKDSSWFYQIYNGWIVVGNRIAGGVEREYCLDINDSKINTMTDDGTGELIRDYTVQSQARFRLTCRRGDWWADPSVGSLLHTISTLGQARRQALLFCQQALQPLIDAGDILSVSITDIEEDPAMGTLAVAVEIEVPSGEAVGLGLIPVGA